MADRPLRGGKWVLIILGIALVTIGVGLISWKLLVKDNPTVQQEQTTVENTNQTVATPNSNNDVPVTSITKKYENGLLALKLDYPETWTISETERRDGVRIESPTFNFQTLDGKDINGNFRIYIRKGAREVDSKYIGRGVSIGDSLKLTYTKPTPGQRTETSLSLFGLDDANNFAFFLIAGNFNLKKGDVLGPNYGKEFDTYIIGGGYSSPELTDDLATHPVSTEAIQESNAYNQALDILRSIQVR